MKRKLILGLLIGIIAAAVLGGGFAWGFRSGENYPKKIVVEGVSNMGSSTAAGVDFGTFWQAWQLLNDNYLRNASTSNADKLHGAVNGLVNSLGDPYTEYFPPAESKQFEQDVQGNFGGIGAELGEKDGQLVVIAPLPGTPASKAGLKAGDAILAINGSSTDSLSI
ncbi:MAG TPA: PDZ domain-containing protein, partial [Candidatus Paceibacterota bacterium]|nr:PDZ domain-containing protein [Candidatus Paceibacterota bacterium]